MSRKEEVYKPALLGKNIPVLTLDNKWHKLFTQTGISKEILAKEESVNALLKKQGKLNVEAKNMKHLKTKLMNEIVALMGDEAAQPDADAIKKQDENKRLIEECNEKLAKHQDEILDVERDIAQANTELMLLTMECCYETLKENTADIEVIDEWINSIRIELKKNVVRKQKKELFNQELYSYMHDIFGPEVIEIFDMKYNPDDNPVKKQKTKESE